MDFRASLLVSGIEVEIWRLYHAILAITAGMAERPEQRPNLKIKTDDLHPYIVYRNPEEDPIRCALEEAVRRLTAEGKPLVLKTRKDL